MSLRVAMVGPTRAGKTVYLASLLRAAFAAAGGRRTVKVRPAPDSTAALRLLDDAAALITGGRLPATAAVSRYELIADLPGSVLFDLGRESLALTLVDPPGGDCLPPPDREAHPEVLAVAAEADGLLVVIPGDEALRPADLGARLAAFLASVRRCRGVAAGRPLYARMALVLTMAEIGVAHRGVGALAALERYSPQAELAQRLGEAGRAAVAGAVARGGDGYSLVSVFGFTAAGAAALAGEAGEWHYAAPGGFAAWRPYRVYEPLEFLARGIVWREAWT